jgi:glycosyltransferase involved in cell wall biosynthesis
MRELDSTLTTATRPPGKHKMRVLHIIGSLQGGGAETLVRELVPRLQSRGLDVAVYCGFEAGLTNAQRSSLGCLILEGRKQGHFDVGFGPRTIGAIKKFRPDVVHTHTWTGKYWGRACAVAGKTKVIVHTEHSPQPLLAAWEVPCARMLSGHTAAFITFSQRNAEHVARREPTPRLEVIPNGIKIEPVPSAADRQRARAALEAPTDMVVIGVVASLQPKKNQRLAIEAFARLTDTSKMRLDLFGAGPEERALRELASTLGVGSRVRFWGFRPDVRALLAGLDLFLSVATVEAAPISLLEAMSASLPILGTPHNGTLDFVEDRVSGRIIREWSTASVADALRDSVADRRWRESAGLAARRRVVEEFDIERVADRHVTLYADLLEHSPSA